MVEQVSYGDEAPAGRTGTALLTKALDVIDRVAATGARPKVADIAAATGYARPTLYRILGALQARGMVLQDPRDHAYTLGPRFTELAGAVARHTELIALAGRPLRAVATTFGEGVNLGVLSGGAQQTIARWPGFDGGDAPGAVGALKPLHCTALGKALLAGRPAPERGAILDGLALERFTPATLADRAALEADLALAAVRGFALDDGEVIEGVACVAVPVPGADGRAAAAISVSGPAHRMTARRRAEVAAEIARVASEVGAALAAAPDEAPLASDAEPVRGFGVVAILPRGRGYLAVDGPGGRVIAVEDGAARTSHRLPGPIRAAVLAGDALLLLAGGRLMRADPAGGEAVPLATGLPEDADALAAGPGGAPMLGAGPRLLRLAGGRWEEVAADRDPDTPILAGSDGPAWVVGGRLAGAGRGAPLHGPVAALARLPGGALAAARSGAWRIDVLGPDGPRARPLPVPRPTALAVADGALLVGSDRAGLTAAEIALAPLSGGVLRLPLDTIIGDAA